MLMFDWQKLKPQTRHFVFLLKTFFFFCVFKYLRFTSCVLFFSAPSTLPFSSTSCPRPQASMVTPRPISQHFILCNASERLSGFKTGECLGPMSVLHHFLLVQNKGSFFHSRKKNNNYFFLYLTFLTFSLPSVRMLSKFLKQQTQKPSWFEPQTTACCAESFLYVEVL